MQSGKHTSRDRKEWKSWSAVQNVYQVRLGISLTEISRSINPGFTAIKTRSHRNCTKNAIRANHSGYSLWFTITYIVYIFGTLCLEKIICFHLGKWEYPPAIDVLFLALCIDWRVKYSTMRDIACHVGYPNKNRLNSKPDMTLESGWLLHLAEAFPKQGCCSGLILSRLEWWIDN